MNRTRAFVIRELNLLCGNLGNHTSARHPVRPVVGVRLSGHPGGTSTVLQAVAAGMGVREGLCFRLCLIAVAAAAVATAAFSEDSSNDNPDVYLSVVS